MAIRDRIKEFRRVKASDLAPNPSNWRKHPTYQRDTLQAVLEEVGIADAVIARETPDGLVLIDGHLRRDILPDTEIPVLVLDVDEAEADKILATLDPLAAMAQTDMDKFLSIAGRIETGSDSIKALLEAVANGENMPLLTPKIEREETFDTGDALNQAEAEEYVPFSKRGQIWRLGEHRLMCGDSTNAEDVESLMDGATPELMVTDPPYGIGIVHVDGATVGGSKPFGSTQRGPKSKNQIIQANRYPVIEGDDKPFDPSHLLNVAAHTVIWGANYFAEKLPASSGWFCWDKRENITRNSFADCELAWTSSGRPARIFHHLWNGLHKGSQHNQRREHPTEKPVALFEWCIEQFTSEGDAVTDYYAGICPTIIAAEKLSRRCYAMEIEPRYVDVAIRRWEDFTGEKAELIGDREE